MGYIPAPLVHKQLAALLRSKSTSGPNVELSAEEWSSCREISLTPRSAVWLPGTATRFVPSDTRVVGVRSAYAAILDEAPSELPTIAALGSVLQACGLCVGDELMWINDTALEGDAEQCMELLEGAVGTVHIIARRPVQRVRW